MLVTQISLSRRDCCLQTIVPWELWGPERVTSEAICISPRASFSATFPSQREGGIPRIHRAVGGIPPHLLQRLPWLQLPSLIPAACSLFHGVQGCRGKRDAGSVTLGSVFTSLALGVFTSIVKAFQMATGEALGHARGFGLDVEQVGTLSPTSKGMFYLYGVCICKCGFLLRR